MDIRYGEGEEMEEQDNFHFLFIAAFSLAASILKYSSTSSTGVSSFFFFTLGALFLIGSLQGLEGPSLVGWFVSLQGRKLILGSHFSALVGVLVLHLPDGAVVFPLVLLIPLQLPPVFPCLYFWALL